MRGKVLKEVHEHEHEHELGHGHQDESTEASTNSSSASCSDESSYSNAGAEAEAEADTEIGVFLVEAEVPVSSRSLLDFPHLPPHVKRQVQGRRSRVRSRASSFVHHTSSDDVSVLTVRKVVRMGRRPKALKQQPQPPQLQPPQLQPPPLQLQHDNKSGVTTSSSTSTSSGSTSTSSGSTSTSTSSDSSSGSSSGASECKARDTCHGHVVLDAEAEHLLHTAVRSLRAVQAHKCLPVLMQGPTQGEQQVVEQVVEQVVGKGTATATAPSQALSQSESQSEFQSQSQCARLQRVDAFELSQRAAPGKIEYFISHSWHDDEAQKVKAWAKFFACHSGNDSGSGQFAGMSVGTSANGGAYSASTSASGSTAKDTPPPSLSRTNKHKLVWLDEIIIKQNNIEDSLRCLPVYLMSCRKVLLLCGETYVDRLW